MRYKYKVSSSDEHMKLSRNLLKFSEHRLEQFGGKHVVSFLAIDL